jgi:hypothetical protein
MDQVIQEAKQESAGKDFDSQADTFFAKADNQEQTSSSQTVEGAVGDQTTTQEAGADQPKNANPESNEKAYEVKLAKIKELLGDDQEAIDAYIKSKGYHKEPAWQKLIERSKRSGVDENLQKELAEFKEVTNSPEYIRSRMERQGYKPEAIDAELVKRGHQVAVQPNDLAMIVEKELNLNPQNFASQAEYEHTKAIVSDVTKIVEIALRKSIPEYLKQSISPIENTVTNIQQKESAISNVRLMQDMVKQEGILDFEKEVEPELQKWMDDKDASGEDYVQDDIVHAFREINHRLAMEKLQTKGKKDERDGLKGNLRTNVSGVTGNAKVPQKTGDFDKDFDATANFFGIR